MKHLSKLITGMLTLTVALALVSGCSVVREASASRVNYNTKSGETWLSDQMEPAGYNIAGHWTSADWGDIRLTQSGRNVGGKFGEYNVRGVVSGQKVYLLLSQAGWTYYTTVLESPAPGVLAGHFSRTTPIVKHLARPIRLEQLAH